MRNSIKVEARINLADQYDTLLGKIRAIPQFERFLKPQACTSLLRSLRDGVLIIVNVCSFGVGALIIRPNSPIHHLPLPTLSEKLLEERALDFVERKDDYLFKSEVLWDGLVRPILGQLEIDPLHPPAHPSLRIRWYLTGPLTSIPLHALGPPDGQDGADLHRLVISSYIMTMSSFSRNTQHPSGPQHMLSVGVRETPGRPNLNSLDYAEDEVKEVIKTLRENGWPPGRITSFDDTTSALVENILPALKTCSWLHLACHGLPNFDSPLQSAFALYDRDLTMEAIASEKLDSAEAAFLSSCFAAAGGQHTPGEAMHLTASMLFIGFRSVVGTLWEVNDYDAKVVAVLFYKFLLEGPQGMTAENVPLALHRAVARLRQVRYSSSPRRWAPFICYGI